MDLCFNRIQLECWFLVLCVGIFSGSVNCECFDTAEEVCSRNISMFPNMPSRDPSIIMSDRTSDWAFCDVYTLETQQWYKSESPMSTTCPSMYSCGTKHPIWMTGENPEPSEGVVNRTACLRDFDTCCLHTYSLTAVNCVDFMAYCIIDLPSSCHQRYCLGLSKTETTTKTVNAKTTDASLQYTSTVSRSSDAITTYRRSPFDLWTKKQISNTYETGRKTDLTATLHWNKDNGEDDADWTVIATLFACNGLLIAVIFGLIVFIIRYKRRTVNTHEEPNKGQTTSDNDKTQYDYHLMPEVSFIDFDKAGNNKLMATGNKSADFAGCDNIYYNQHHQPIPENGKGT